MIHRPVAGAVPFALALALLGSPARAATFDFICADRLEVTTYPSNVGFTLSGTDIGLVVNKGASDIGAAEFFGATFTSSSSNPAVTASPFINNPGPAITPIHPNEAIGSVSSFNGVLTARLLPGETLHNTAPLQVISLGLSYPPGFSGQVMFNLGVTMGGEVAHYTILVNFTFGQDFAIAFPSAARTSSVPLATPARATTWGAIKKLYR